MMHTALTDILAALGLLSRLPLPLDAEEAMRRGAASAWAYPAAGLAIGAIAALAGVVAGWAGLPAPLQAAVMLATLLAVTGAMHEDGLADSADGLWGGWDRARRLEIMKDSRVGTYGVIALFLSLLTRWSALTWLLLAGASPWLVAGVAALSRAPMVALMAWVPGARHDGLSAGVGHPAGLVAWQALALGTALAILFLGFAAIWPIIWAGAAALAVALVAKAKIGGQTGDILGAAQQLSETAALASLCAVLA